MAKSGVEVSSKLIKKMNNAGVQIIDVRSPVRAKLKSTNRVMEKT